MSRINESICAWYKTQLGSRAARVYIKRYHDDPLAWVFKTRRYPIYLITVTNEFGKAIAESVLKFYANETEANEAFNTLERLSQGFTNLHLDAGVPTPLTVFPGLDALLMSRLRGNRLDKILWSSITTKDRQTRSARAIDAIRKAGSWLAAFQKVGLIERRSILTGEMLLSEIRSFLAECRTLQLGSREVKPIEDWLSMIEEDGSKVKCNCTNTCDFHPRHIFVSGGRTCVLDVEKVSCDWPTENIASFLLNCQMYKQSIYSMNLTNEMLLATFLESYASQAEFKDVWMGSSATQFLTVLDLCYLRELLETLVNPSYRSGSFTWEIMSWLAKREIRRRSASGKWQPLFRGNQPWVMMPN